MLYYKCVVLTSSPQILILIFAEVLGLYGLIVALIMNSRAGDVAGAVSKPPLKICCTLTHALQCTA